MPFFSVITCTYNRAGLLPRAIDSLLGQDETDWELIIVDDGSTDNTKSIASQYAEELPGIKYLCQEHCGLPSARNYGVKSAKGKFITFLDSDDEYKPNHLSIRKKILTDNPEIDIIHSNASIIGESYVPDKDNP